MKDSLGLQVLDPHGAVVALTHDPKLDDTVRPEALKSPAEIAVSIVAEIIARQAR